MHRVPRGPDGDRARPGTRVLVSFRGRERIGWIVGDGSPPPNARILPVIDVLEAEPHSRFRFRWTHPGEGGIDTEVLIEIRPRGYGSSVRLSDGPYEVGDEAVLDEVPAEEEPLEIALLDVRLRQVVAGGELGRRNLGAEPLREITHAGQGVRRRHGVAVGGQQQLRTVIPRGHGQPVGGHAPG